MSGKSLQPSAEEIQKEKETFKALNDPQTQERLYVHQVYNQIAAHFSQTRYKPWPLIEQFLQGLPSHSIGVDVGCGNGKYLAVNDQLFIVGSDYSTGLVEQASALHKSQRCNDLMVADGLALPHPDKRFDFAISIAVIHHFSTEERRVDAIREILRVLKPQGKAMIYCWALEQRKSRRGYHEGMDQDTLVPWISKKPADGPEEAATTEMRYYHLYKQGELADNCRQAGGTVIDEGYERDNWWVITGK